MRTRWARGARWSSAACKDVLKVVWETMVGPRKEKKMNAELEVRPAKTRCKINKK